MQNLRSIAQFFARPAWMLIALPWLMGLVALGTVAQRYIGLYASQKLFFGSFVLWAGMVPLPGAYSILLLLAVSLLAKLLLQSPLSVKQSGVILAHLSVLVLLLGGFLTAMNREEGYVVLGDGDSAATVSDYLQRDLSIVKNGEALAPLHFKEMHAGESYQMASWPFKIQVLQTCFPCNVHTRAHKADKLRGIATKLALASVPYAKEDAENRSGIEFVITGVGPEQDGTYIAFESLLPEIIVLGKDRYELALRPTSRPLPFSVRLLHFAKSDYPGTDEARSYSSDVTVKDGPLEWNTTIEMNQPLRFKGYTLYQSSFVTDGERLLSVLAVVKNAGEWFPYIALALLCTGLIAHIFIMLKAERKA